MGAGDEEIGVEGTGWLGIAEDYITTTHHQRLMMVNNLSRYHGNHAKPDQASCHPVGVALRWAGSDSYGVTG